MMNSKPFGMFGPGGLLSKIEAEGSTDIRVYQSFVDEHPVNSLVHTRSDENLLTNKRLREADDQSNNPDHKALKITATNTLDKSTYVERPILSEQHKSLETSYHCTEDMHNWSSTSEANFPNPFVPLSDLPPIQAVFSIEKISRTIFSLLEPSDLLQCRLVSSSWLQMATNDKLLKRNKNVIQIGYALHSNEPVYVTLKGRSIHLKDLTDFLDSLGSHTLPCSASMVVNTTIAPNDFFKFLDCYGFVVNSLRLAFPAKDDGEFFVYFMNSVLEFVTKLLTEQMPNLETLSMKVAPKAKFAGEIDPQLLVKFKEGLYCAGKQNQNLRTLKFYEHNIPYEIIEAICCLAPKAQDLLFFRSWGFWVKNKHRLYLLKALFFIPLLDRLDHVSEVEAVLNSKERVGLRKLNVNFAFVHYKPELWPSLATIVKKAFEKSSDTLEELDLVPIYFLPGTVLPRMSKVKSISMNSNEDVHPEWSFLPKGTSIAACFPCLHTIKCEGKNSMTHFLSLCKDEKVASVKKLKIHWLCSFEKNELQKRFPNGDIDNSCNNDTAEERIYRLYL